MVESNDPSSCCMFTIPKIDKPNEPRFLLDLVGRNDNTIKDNTPLPNQDEIRNRVALHKFRSKIDLTDGYHNIRVNPDHEKYTSFSTPFGQFRTRVMQ